MSKIMSAKEVAELLEDNDTIMIGGFGERGYPREILKALQPLDVKNLNFIVNALNKYTRIELEEIVMEKGAHLTSSFVRMSDTALHFFKEGKMTMIPQGTLAESIRLGGMGIPAYYNPVGIGTEFETGKEIREFNGKKYLLEESLVADKALMRVNIADKSGNCHIKGAAKSFSPAMAYASKNVYIEAEKIVEVGELDPEVITIPGILVTGIVFAEKGGR